MKDLRELVGDLSQTNHYLVSFSTLNSTLMSYIQKRVGFSEDTRNFLSRKTGLLCSEASLPTSSLATGEVRDNFMGIPQEFAHTRLYTDIDFTFYIDSNYVNLRIFEAWMDYIAGGSQSEISELDENYYRRMNYPDNYKVQTMFISKFERDFNSQIDYQFINAFPKLVTAIPVSYGAADLLKVTVSFTYDRYIVNPKGSIRKANSSGFSDIARVANDTAIRDQEIQALMDDGGYSKEDATTIQGGGFVETVFEPEKTPPVERIPTSQAQEVEPTVESTSFVPAPLVSTSRSAQLEEVAQTGGGLSRELTLRRLIRQHSGDRTAAYNELDRIFPDRTRGISR